MSRAKSKAQPDWLTDEEQRTWRAFIEASTRLIERLDHELQRDAGVPHAYYPILVNLSEAPDRTMRMSELADGIGCSRSRLSHAMARLEEAGWAVRRECPTDKRGSVAQLTDVGMAAIAAAAPGHVAAVRRYLFDQLSADQQAQLRTACEAVLEALEKREGVAGGSAPDSSCDLTRAP